ncbi:MAG: hypothetical protein CMI24_05125 [Opitutae bacterium]|nr:hypothetical protein [Opitutae bacterium]
MRVKKKSDIVCSKDNCRFPNTCKWNQKCMQKDLDLSIAAKRTSNYLTEKKSKNDAKKKKI